MPQNPDQFPFNIEPPFNESQVDDFMFRLESLLPPEAEVMWISPTSQSEQILSVQFSNKTIYFAGEDLSSDDFYNWNDYFSPQKLWRCLEKNLKIDQACNVQALADNIRHAIAQAGMLPCFDISVQAENVVISHASDGTFFASCGTDKLPKTYIQVRAEIEALLEIEDPETADNFESFMDLFKSVNANEFQGAFSWNSNSRSAVEVLYKNGHKHGKKELIRLAIDPSFWKNGISRGTLVDFLTDQVKEALNERRLEYSVFMELFRQIASDYPDLKYQIGLTSAYFISADKRKCYFTGTRVKMAKVVNPIAQKFCANNGYQYGKIDCAQFMTESKLRTFFEYDLGYACPAPLSEAEKRINK